MSISAAETRPIVSVILVNYRGSEDVIECVSHLREVDWPADRLEIVVVDNDSQDGSEERLREELSEVTIIQSGANLGFAGGCNLGVEHSTGEYVAFLNSDAKPDPQWVAAAIAEFESAPDVGCVASKVLDWDGKQIDYVDGALSWFGMGYKREVTQFDTGAYDTPKDVLFGTGAAMFVRRDLFREVGGFDERYFMFFEDVDFGWRLNLLGHRVRYVPGSLAFHKHHVAIKKFGAFRETYLLERNALITLYKNLGDGLLGASFGPALVAAAARERARETEVSGQIDGAAGTAKMGLTGTYAVDYFLEQLDSLAESRREIQDNRTVPDEDILPLFRSPMNPLVPLPDYVGVHDAVVDLFRVGDSFHLASRVLVVTGDMLSDKMAGPAIRAWEMAKALARHCEVQLVSTTASKLTEAPGFTVHQANGPELQPFVEWADVLVFQGYLLHESPWIAETDTIIVADIYDPFHLEQLEQARDLGEKGRKTTIAAATYVLNSQISRADLMLCASDKQRAFWVGQAAVNGRVNSVTARQFGSVEDMIKVVPFGVGDQPPVQKKHGIRGTVPGIGMDDKVILWGGGVYNWFDPLTLVQAVARLAERHDDVRLFFMGLKHPNPAVPEMRVAWELRELSDSLGLTDKHVFFNSGWVPYEERADWLLDADVGVSTHFHHVETAYSFRTRILDYLWAGLPIVATTGDSFGNVLDSEGIGIGVPHEDVDALEAALETMLYDAERHASARAEVARYAEQFRWNRVLAPLIDFCTNPVRAADVDLRAGAPALVLPPAKVPNTLRGDLRLAREYLRAGGVKMVVSKARGRLRKMVNGTGKVEA